MQSYKELEVWQRSMEMVGAIYRLTEQFPKSETFGLTSQLRRAAVSVPSNIAEGYGRGHRTEYIQFSRVAYGSALEVETQLLVAAQIGYCNGLETDANQYLQSSIMMLKALIRSLATH